MITVQNAISTWAKGAPGFDKWCLWAYSRWKMSLATALRHACDEGLIWACHAAGCSNEGEALFIASQAKLSAFQASDEAWFALCDDKESSVLYQAWQDEEHVLALAMVLYDTVKLAAIDQLVEITRSKMEDG